MTSDRIESIRLDHIRPGAHNPRKHLDEAKLAELAESVRHKGLLQPILVRQVGTRPDRYEVVAGERRYRAAYLAGLELIPCLVRELDDRACLEIAVTENEQREDVSPLERAAGYRALVEEHGATVEEVAQRVGKSSSTVRGLLKLLELPEQAKKALEAGDISPSVAQLIARVPGDIARKEAADWATTKDYWGERPSYRHVREEIQHRFMVELKSAPFRTADAKLLPEAGSCRLCPHRTGNNREEFPDARADVCTLPECYRRKVEAHRRAAGAEARAQGLKVLGDDAPARFGDTDRWGRSKWIRTTEVWDGESGEQKTVEEWVGGRLDAKRAWASWEDGQTAVLVPRKEAVAIIEEQLTTKRDRREEKAANKTQREPHAWQVEEKARELALSEIVAMGQANFEALDPLAANGGPETDAAYQALRMVTLVYACEEIDFNQCEAVRFFVPGFYEIEDWNERRTALVQWTGRAAPRDLLAMLLGLAGERVMGGGAGEVEIRDTMLEAFTDGGWKAIEKRARKELCAEFRAKLDGRAKKKAKAPPEPEMEAEGEDAEAEAEEYADFEAWVAQTPRCPDPVPAVSPQPAQTPVYYAWEMRIRLNTGGEETVTYVAKNEKAARRKAMMRRNASEVLSCEGMTEEQYRRLHGQCRARLS